MVLFGKVVAYLFVIVIAYLLGSISWAVIYSRATTKGDIRKLGSKNPGSGNIARVFNFKIAVLVFFLDVLKSFISGLLAWSLTQVLPLWNSVFPVVFILIIFLVVLLGHLYPVFHKFKGGKGVAVFFGFLLFYNVLFFILAFIVLCLVYAKYRLISLGSIIIPTIFFGFAWIPWFTQGPLNFFLDFNPASLYTKYFWILPSFIFVVNLAILWKHIPNIKRLIAGKEKKFSSKN